MKKLSKIFAVVLTLAMVLSILPMGAAAAAETVTFDFTTNTKASTTSYTATTAKTAFDGFASASGYLTEVKACSYVYPGHEDSNNSASVVDTIKGCLKLGKSKNGGVLELTFSKKVTKVEILAHEYHLYSAQYPNADTIAVNDGTAKGAPYTTDATFATMTFELDTASETVKIKTSERVLVKSITVTFEETTGDDTTGGDNTTGGDTGVKDPDKVGDDTAVVAMTTMMVVAVAALAVLVINKKRMF
ncbi:MAG: hypothetical protein E7468_06505 [Ruminococcaceae bacterium]|nr:hypothetical protein [Oscillospiraceae bacterium]